MIILFLSNLQNAHYYRGYEEREISIELLYVSLKDIMAQLEGVGWVKASKKESQEITELDMAEIFNMIDVDKSGSVSRRVTF